MEMVIFQSYVKFQRVFGSHSELILDGHIQGKSIDQIYTLIDWNDIYILDIDILDLIWTTMFPFNT